MHFQTTTFANILPVIMLIASCVLIDGHQHDEDVRGCTGPVVLPNQPFVVVWNLHSLSNVCPKGMLNFSRWGIAADQGDDYGKGKEITIFYGNNQGDFPYITKNNTWVNGGIPQLGNLTEHLSKIKTLVENDLPDKNFAGLSVYDFERWRADFAEDNYTYRIYEKYSIDLVKKQHPDWTNKTQIYLEAAKEFDAAAKLFFLSTLQLSQKLRPGGYWGYFGYPKCVNYLCSGMNEKLEWLWKGSTGLYPSIYTLVTQTWLERILHVERTMNETVRLQAKYLLSDMLIMPYTFDQTNSTYFDSEADLDIAIKMPGDIGSSGVVIWGMSSIFKQKGECQLFQAYLDYILGPYVLNLSNFYTNCSNTKCTGHGRCVEMKNEIIYQEYLQQYGRTTCRRPSEELKKMKADQKNLSKKGNRLNSDDYVCRCYSGWKGPTCNIKTK